MKCTLSLTDFAARRSSGYATIMVIALLALTWSSRAFCGEIHDAAGRGDLKGVEALLRREPDLAFSRNDNGQTALHYAAYGHKDVAEVLLIALQELVGTFPECTG